MLVEQSHDAQPYTVSSSAMSARSSTRTSGRSNSSCRHHCSRHQSLRRRMTSNHSCTCFPGQSRCSPPRPSIHMFDCSNSSCRWQHRSARRSRRSQCRMHKLSSLNRLARHHTLRRARSSMCSSTRRRHRCSRRPRWMNHKMLVLRSLHSLIRIRRHCRRAGFTVVALPSSA